jgi:hypothetical protein
MRLQALSPRLGAVGLGGSLGHRKAADEYSDIDLFLFFESGDVFEQARWFSEMVGHSDVVSAGAPDFFPGFGLRLSYVLAGLGKVEYFLNTPSSWTPDPMRSNTNVIWDDTGSFTALVAVPDADTKEQIDRRVYREHLHLLLLASFDVAKHAKRSDLLSLEYRLAIARRTIASLAVSQQGPGEGSRIHDALLRSPSLPTKLRMDLTLGIEPGRDRAGFGAAVEGLAKVARTIPRSDADAKIWLEIERAFDAAAGSLRD